MNNGEQTTAPEAALIEAAHKAAEGGNVEAQYRLGMLYASGEGVPLDYVSGANWLRKAADQGHTEAMRALAMMHASGMGVEQDNAETRRWLLAAAEGGNALAQTTVAAMYQFGQHEAQKDTKAMLYWYQQAAEQDYAKAQFALGKLLAAGELVQQNDEAAFQWLTLAIMNDSTPAQKELAQLTARVDEGTLNEWKARMMHALGAGHA